MQTTITSYNPSVETPMMTMIPIKKYTTLQDALADYAGYQIAKVDGSHIELNKFNEVNPDDAFSFLDRDVPDDIVYLLIE